MGEGGCLGKMGHAEDLRRPAGLAAHALQHAAHWLAQPAPHPRVQLIKHQDGGSVSSDFLPCAMHAILTLLIIY